MARRSTLERPKRLVKAVDSPRVSLLLTSDWHWGASWVDEDRLKEDLDWALDNDARILLGGDIHNAIFRFDKRYEKPSVDRSVLLRTDEVNASVESLVEFMLPYKDNIDFFGIGNHEDVVLQRFGLDLQALIASGLGLDKSTLGGYCNFISYRLAPHRLGPTLDIFFFHGAGRYAPVTMGVIEFNRIKVFVEDVDIIWLAHAHESTVLRKSVLRCGNGKRGVFSDVFLIRTGGYGLWGQDPWAVRKGLPPKPSGGIGVVAEKVPVGYDGYTLKLEVVQWT